MIKKLSKFIKLNSDCSKAHEECLEISDLLSKDACCLYARENDKVHGGSPIFIKGSPGLAGARIIYRYHKELIPDLGSCISLEYDRSVKTSYDKKSKLRPCFCFNLGERGIAQGLFDMKKCLNKGFTVDICRIPVKQEVIEICEALKLNPFKMLSSGCFLWVFEETDVEKIQEVYGDICLIGYINEGPEMKLINNEDISLLNRIDSDELMKVLVKKDDIT